MILLLVAIFFVVMESANVLALYFRPGTRKFNGVGVFDAWEKSKEDPDVHAFVKYLVYWVAGTKLIFLSLLVVIFATADLATQVWAVVALALSITTFFWKLFPLIKAMDKKSQVHPQNYSKILGRMILGILVALAAALVATWLGA